MEPGTTGTSAERHSHLFLGRESGRNEKQTWVVVGLTTLMTLVEIVGGGLTHSIALVADGIHMSTHAFVMLLAALAYRYARRHASDERFALGTGKLGDLAAFASAIILAMFALLIGYEAITRFLTPRHIDYAVAIPIAALGLLVNVASALVLSGDHDHSHGHSHGHGMDHAHTEFRLFSSARGTVRLEIFEEGVPPRFRLSGWEGGTSASIETLREDGARQTFTLLPRSGFWESREEIPEPHAFGVQLALEKDGHTEHHQTRFEEPEGHSHTHSSVGRDHNIRAAYLHVLADSAVSAMVIAGLLMARYLGWAWMDPVMGLTGAVVVASWSWGLVRDAGAVLLDMTPDMKKREEIRSLLEKNGDTVTDLHLWRLGPGHLGAIVALQTADPQPPETYRGKLGKVGHLSHITIEIGTVRSS